jgi:dipeptidase E
VPGSFCPHYDAEDQRRPLFHQALLDGVLPAGYGVDDLASLHFHGTSLVAAIGSAPGARAIRVSAEHGQITETDLPMRVIGD